MTGLNTIFVDDPIATRDTVRFIARAFDEVGIRSVLAYEVSDRDGPDVAWIAGSAPGPSPTPTGFPGVSFACSVTTRSAAFAAPGRMAASNAEQVTLVQELTDHFIVLVDKHLAAKEKEIMAV